MFPPVTVPVNVAPERLALVASCELIKVMFAGVANKVDTFEAPEYRVFPERIVPNTVLPAMFPPVTVPVNVAPERLALVASCELIKVMFAGVANKVDTFEAPEYRVFPEIVVPKIVVPTMVPPLTVPVKVAPERLAFVASCELIKVMFAGVANKVDTFEAPEYIVFPERAVPNTVLPAILPPVTVPVNVAPLRFAFVASCELIKVMFAGVANKVDTSVEPE